MTESSRGIVKIEPGRKRVRPYLNGEIVADTVRPFLVCEWPYYPAYYVPADDVRDSPASTTRRWTCSSMARRRTSRARISADHQAGTLAP